jgi:hypothetical protein
MGCSEYFRKEFEWILGCLSWYQWGCWFRQGKPISPLYHAVFYTNNLRNEWTVLLQPGSIVVCRSNAIVCSLLHYYCFGLPLLYICFDTPFTPWGWISILVYRYIYTHLASWVTYCQLARSSLAHAWHVTWQIGICISRWYSYSILDSLDSPTQVSSLHNQWWLLDIHTGIAILLLWRIFFSVLPWESVMHSRNFLVYLEVTLYLWRTLLHGKGGVLVLIPTHGECGSGISW